MSRVLRGEGVAEALERINGLETESERVLAIQKAHSKAMEALMDICYHPAVKSMMPEGEVPYKAQPKEADLQSNLKSSYGRIKLFVNVGGYPQVKPLKRESSFISYLEGLDPDDAELLISVLNKKMPYKNINKKLFNKAWPTLAATWDERKNLKEKIVKGPTK